MTRSVIGLQWARALEGWPPEIPTPRARGIKAFGVRYEKAVVKELGDGAARGQWWEYFDANGPGLCQTDIVIDGKIWTAVFECKHTWTEEGMKQLTKLYLPVVGKARRKPTLGIQICKHLGHLFGGHVHINIHEAIEEAKTNGVATCHWRAIGPLLAEPRRETLAGMTISTG